MRSSHWAHAWLPYAGWLAPVPVGLLGAATACILVVQFAPAAEESGIQRVEAVFSDDVEHRISDRCDTEAVIQYLRHSFQLFAKWPTLCHLSLPDKTFQLPKGLRDLPLFALYKKHCRDLLMVPSISLRTLLCPKIKGQPAMSSLPSRRSCPW